MIQTATGILKSPTFSFRSSGCRQLPAGTVATHQVVGRGCLRLRLSAGAMVHGGQHGEQGQLAPLVAGMVAGASNVASG